jgi:alpha-L-fucosidase
MVDGSSFRPMEKTGSMIGGWFGPKGDRERMTAAEIWSAWMESVGAGAGLILNLPPTVTGSIPQEWAAPAIEFGEALRASFATPVASLLRENTTVACGADAPPLELSLAGVGPFNAVRSAEDVFHHGQLVLRYEIVVDGRNVTSRGRSVGVGTIDAGAEGTGFTLDAAPKRLAWRCLQVYGGAKSVTLSALDVYNVKPPPLPPQLTSILHRKY